jgi:6-pyruvoyl tetrahydropterin synthase
VEKNNIMQQTQLENLLEKTRSHYPSGTEILGKSPYRSIKSSDTLKPKRYLQFEYLISSNFYRQHCNPPIWTNYHYHDFQVTLHLTSLCYSTDLYGVDMIEVEKILQDVCDRIPKIINELPECPEGTTEQLCIYFASVVQFPDPNIKIKAVSVSESPERVTKLSLG